MAKKTMYHATRYENLIGILNNGIITGVDGIVYLCEEQKDAIKFPFVSLVKDILVVEVELEESELFETFDHNEKFFGCRAYGIARKIEKSEITNYFRYDLR